MSHIQKLLVLVVLLLLSACTAQAKQDAEKSKDIPGSGTGLSAPDKQHILQDHFIIVKTVQAIPKSVLSDLLGKDIRAGMADAGQPFERTDVVGPKPLPFRRLIFAAISDGYCLVYSEHGGIAYWTEVSLYRLTTGSAIRVWKASLMDFSGALSLPQLQSKIQEGKFVTEPRQEDIPKPKQPAPPAPQPSGHP